MKRSDSGQSLVETSILASLIALGTFSLWMVCNANITRYIDLVLAIIASPVP